MNNTDDQQARIESLTLANIRLMDERDHLRKELGIQSRMHDARRVDFNVLQAERDRLKAEKVQLLTTLDLVHSFLVLNPQVYQQPEMVAALGAILKEYKAQP